jgi:hypothetical protein
MAPAPRRLPWYEEEGKTRPVLLEVRRLQEAGLAALRKKPLDIPNVLTAAGYLDTAVDSKDPLAVVKALLDRILDPDSEKWVTGDKYRLAASRLLGHDDETFGESLEARRNAVAQSFYQDVQTFRRNDRGGEEPALLRAICVAVENVINEGSEREAVALARALERHRDVSSAPYVHRPELERSLASLIKARPSAIAVAGPPSTGKRALVSRLLTDLGITSVIIIDGSDPEVARHGMVEALHDWGATPYEEVGALPQYQVRSLLESSRAPEYLVIENAADSGWLDFFTTARSQTTIIATTTRHLRTIDQSHYVKVGAMEPEEAVELVQALIPTAPEQDASMLGRLLDHQVLAIIAACGMIRHSEDGSISEFCRNLSRNMAAVFDGELGSPGSGEQPALTQIYRKTLADLERENPQALAALELIAYLAEGTVPSSFIVLSLASSLGIDPGDKGPLKAIAQRAINALQDRYLVSVDERSVLTVPDLTRTIISDLVHERGSKICEHLRKGLLSVISLSRGTMQDVPLMDFVRLHSLTLFQLTHTYIDPKKSGNFAGFVYFYAGAITELLKAIGVPAWRIAIIVFESAFEQYSVSLMELPEKMANVERPALVIGWSDPEPHRLEREILNWRARKAMQLVVVDRSGAAFRDFTELANED